MVKLFVKTTGFIFLLLGFAGIALGGGSVTRNITANIDPQDGLDVHITKVTNGQWPPAGTPSESSIAFGTLTYDSTNHIFLPNCYYAVDVGVLSNAADWTVTHTISSMINQSGFSANLDHNVNVTFARTENVVDPNTGEVTGTNDTILDKITFAESNNRSYTKSQLSSGWLRIYYGIATGNKNPSNGTTDAPNALPITTDKPAGNYVGSVTITLTP